jgi:hypothetical protein
MNINELFDKIEEGGLSESLNGELIVKGNCMIWTYDLNKNSEEIEAPTDEDEESEFSFDVSSPEELLLEAYTEDLEKLQEFLDENEETENWTFSEPETSDTIISFRIF